MTSSDSFRVKDIPDWTSFLQVRNVRSINMTIYSFDRTIETHNPPADEGELPVFFAVDTLIDNAFLHWQNESAVFLRYYDELKEIFPKLQILLNHDRVFKRLTLRACGIPPERIIFGGCSILPQRNLCILPPQHIMDARSPVDSVTFIELWSRYIYFLRDSAGVKDGDPKTINVLALPRQSRENFVERDVPETREMCEWVSKFEKGKVLHTDTITDLLDQVRIVASSHVIMVDYGSSFYVNASFAADALIIVSNRPQVNTHMKGIATLTWIESRGNRVVYVPKFSDTFSMIEDEIKH